VKTFRTKSNFRQKEAELVSLAKSFQSEVWYTAELRHPNIVSLVGVDATSLSLVLERALLGNLYSFLHKIGREDSPILAQEWSWTLLLTIAKDVASGMKYLHDRNIIFRDLKTPNILLSSLSTSGVVAQLTDLGDARRVTAMLKGEEMLRLNPAWVDPTCAVQRTFTQQTDMYSFGICLHELITRQHPFAEFHDRVWMLDVIGGVRPTIPPNTPELYNKLVSAAWHVDHAQRPTFSDAALLLLDMRQQCSTWESPMSLQIKQSLRTYSTSSTHSPWSTASNSSAPL